MLQPTAAARSWPIVDCHCHAGPGDGFTGPWDTRAPVERYLQRARRAGIGMTVFFAAFHSDYEVANRAVAEIVAAHPGRAIGFAFVNANTQRGRIRPLLEAAVKRDGFRGVKVHRHDAPLTREVCEAARALRVPILYDVVGEVATVELFATEYPDVNFIIPHLSSFAEDWRAQLHFIDQLVRHPNVFTDTSGVRRFDMLTEAVRRAGAHKVLFGSDGPWLHPAVELAKIHALRLDARDEAAIVGGNLLRLIGSSPAGFSSQLERVASAARGR